MMEEQSNQAYRKPGTDTSPLAIAYKQAALARISDLLDDLFDNARDRLAELSPATTTSGSDAHDLTDVLDSLHLQRARISTAFIAELGHAIDNPSQASTPATALLKPDAEPALRLQECARQTGARFQAAADTHSHLVTTANQQRHIKISPTALLPETLFAAFGTSVSTLGLSERTEIASYQLFEQCLLTGLDALYRDLDALLAEHGIQAKAQPKQSHASDEPEQADFDWSQYLQTLQADITPEHVYGVGELWEALDLLQNQEWVPQQPQDLLDTVRQSLRSNQADSTPRTLDDEHRRLLTTLATLLADIRTGPAMQPTVRARIDRLFIILIKTALLAPAELWRPDHPARAMINDLATVDEDAAANASFQNAMDQILAPLFRQFDEQPRIIATTTEQIAALCARSGSGLNQDAQLRSARRRSLLELRQQTLPRQAPASLVPFLLRGWAPYLALQHRLHGRVSKPWLAGVRILQRLLIALAPDSANNLASNPREQHRQLAQVIRPQLRTLGLAGGRLANLMDILAAAFADAENPKNTDPAHAPASPPTILEGLQDEEELVFDDEGEHDATAKVFDRTVAHALSGTAKAGPQTTAQSKRSSDADHGVEQSQAMEQFLKSACTPGAWFQISGDGEAGWVKFDSYDTQSGLVYLTNRKGDPRMQQPIEQFIKDLLAQRLQPIHEQPAFTAHLRRLTRKLA